MKVGEVYALLGLDFSQFDKDERTAKQRTQTLGASLSGIIKNAFSFTLGMGFFQAIQQGFRASVGSALDFNVTMEQARIGFETMLGSASRAESLLSNLASFAERTPFEFSGLLDASKRMLALGFSADRIIPTLRAVGNAAAGLGAGQQGIDRIILALGQMQAKGKVTGEEMRQLTEAGIQAWDILAESMGKSTQEVMSLASRGLIPADRAVQALVEGMETRFPNMMAQMEDSWKGITSTISEVWKMTLGEVTNSLFERAKEWLKGVRDTMVRFREAFRAGGLSYAIEQTFGAKAAASINTLASALKGLWGIVSGTAQTIVRYWSVIGPLTMGVVKAFLAFKAATFVVNAAAAAVRTFTMANLAMHGSLVNGTGLLKLISDIVLYYKCLIPATVGTFGFSTALTYLKTALLAVQTALGAVIWPILIIGVLLMGGISLWNKYNQAVQSAAQKAQMEKMAQQQKEYIDSVNKAAQGTGAQADALEELGKAANKNLQSFDEVHTLMEETAAADLGIGTTLDSGLTPPAIPEMELPDFSFDFDAAIADAKAEMGGFWGWLKTSAADAWGSVKQWGANLWDGVKGGWTGFREWCGGFWGNLKLYAGQAWNTIKTDASSLWEGVKGAWGSFKEWAGGLWDGVKEKWGGFKTWAGETWDGIKTTLGEKWQGIKTKAAETWEGIRTGAATGWENIKTTIATKWENFKAGASQTWEQVKTGAGIAWENIKTGASTGWDGIKTVISTKWDSLKTGASNTWTNIKTSASTAWQNIKSGASSGWDGIKTTVSTRWNSLKTGASTTWSNIKSTISGKWNELKAEAPTTWESIKTGIATRWDQLKASAPGTWDNIKSAISTRFGEAKENVLTAAQNMYDKVPKSWDEMRSAIEQLRGKVIGAISGPFESAKETVLGIVDSAKNWGKNLISNIVDGIKATASRVKDAVSGVVGTIKGWLGFSSPTEEGPGRYADRWAPSLMKMYAEGILNNVGMVKAAVATVAESLSGMAVAPISAPAFAGAAVGRGLAMVGEAGPEILELPRGARVTPLSGGGDLADEIARAVYQAVIDAMRIAQVTTPAGGGDRTIVLKVGEREIARAVLPGIIEEGQRQGLQLVVRPVQGV